ncbi:hypothetical protein HMPREF0658_0836 [Hoylesella marshii DSM 16973 = JCM 13450]|uniref:Uncharacterized protein n=1 Tax=Hoylesella marshii DSM 16973 = JCM 13450 TaxID=862515 RepID=E0NRN5_9BACT|nr:hypothetical protein HMPREF0658_0836 [Hoylesella marshii DSM 16973 = JCM 13450]
MLFQLPCYPVVYQNLTSCCVQHIERSVSYFALKTFISHENIVI